MADNFCDPVTPNLWPPSSPDLNPLNYYAWGVVEREGNNGLHNTKDSLKAAISHSMANVSKDHVTRACSRLRSRIESLIAADGRFIE